MTIENKDIISSTEVYFNDLESSDTYLKLVANAEQAIPSEFINLIFTIRRASEWRKLIDNLVVNSYGTSFESVNISGFYFGFLRVILPDSVEQYAIQTGKKFFPGHQQLATLILKHGLSFEDFVGIKKDEKLYVGAVDFIKQKDYVNAIQNLEEAIRLNSKEDLYTNLLIDTRLQIGDFSGIQKAIEFYKNDMDNAVHAGYVGNWLSGLVTMRQFGQALELIKIVDDLLNDLVRGKRQNKRFGSQPKWFYESSKESFRKNLPDFIKFPSVNAIVDKNSPSTELYELLMVAVTWSQTKKSRILAERSGDAFNKWNRYEEALNFYKIAIQYVTEEDQKGIERIQRKIQKNSPQ